MNLFSDNPMCEFHPTFYTNHIAVISQEKNVVAINGSIEVDLTGQIGSESIGNTMVSGTGGQLDFAIGGVPVRWRPGDQSGPLDNHERYGITDCPLYQ